MNKDSTYDDLFKGIVGHIENYRDNISVIKEQALLEMYWNMGEELLTLKPLTESILDDFKKAMNHQLGSDPLFKSDGTNRHWLKLAVRWVEEHQYHDKSIMLSGKAAWADWALVLDIVNSPTHRYWLICQTIKNKWDRLTLLREAQKLPKQYLNLGDNA
ncbi:DUF1016 N-terminal domain-containing protein [Candidiatus Paracoxiella cheracis]|uniref:DUF1016 N-terminal domain-containing protein n=1 Tax=Candidiatus Paracoxiella cheracis TaxID=3405120 RepID=UPI003BF537B7